MDKEKAIKDATDAVSILDNPKIKGFLEAYRRRIYTEIKNTSMKEDDERRELWHKLNLVEDFERTMLKFIETGHMADESKSLFKRWFK